MATNKFLQFAENTEDIQTDEQYALDTQRINGLQAGLARSEMHNKLFKQTAMMASAIAQVMADNGVNVDDSSFATLVANLKSYMLSANFSSLSAATASLYGLSGSDANADKALRLVSGAKWGGKIIQFSSPTSTSNSSATATFDTALFDDFGVADFSNNPTKMFVPIGATRVKITALVKMGKSYSATVTKNSLGVYTFATSGSSGRRLTTGVAVFDVVDGDYFGLYFPQGDNYSGVDAGSTLMMEILK